MKLNRCKAHRCKKSKGCARTCVLTFHHWHPLRLLPCRALRSLGRALKKQRGHFIVLEQVGEISGPSQTGQECFILWPHPTVLRGYPYSSGMEVLGKCQRCQGFKRCQSPARQESYLLTITLVHDGSLESSTWDAPSLVHTCPVLLN